MRKISAVLIIIGIILVIAGNVFSTKTDNAVDTRTVRVNASNSTSLKLPMYIGVILLFVGTTFYLAGRKNSKTNHS